MSNTIQDLYDEKTIEEFSLEDLKDETLKCVDELFNRGWNINQVIEWITNGRRKQ